MTECVLYYLQGCRSVRFRRRVCSDTCLPVHELVASSASFRWSMALIYMSWEKPETALSSLFHHNMLKYTKHSSPHTSRKVSLELSCERTVQQCQVCEYWWWWCRWHDIDCTFLQATVQHDSLHSLGLGQTWVVLCWDAQDCVGPSLPVQQWRDMYKLVVCHQPIESHYPCMCGGGQAIGVIDRLRNIESENLRYCTTLFCFQWNLLPCDGCFMILLTVLCILGSVGDTNLLTRKRCEARYYRHDVHFIPYEYKP